VRHTRERKEVLDCALYLELRGVPVSRHRLLDALCGEIHHRNTGQAGRQANHASRMAHQDGSPRISRVTVYLLQAHRLRVKFLHQSLKLAEQRLKTLSQVLTGVSRRTNHPGFEKAYTIVPAFDHAVAGDVKTRVDSNDAVWQPVGGHHARGL
jgi:hypothetical protein